jgi:hypothetical protein
LKRLIFRPLRAGYAGLVFMGIITAGSLFPGLDGVCESLGEKNFS